MNTNHRTRDEELQKVITESFTGHLSARSEEIILSLDRKLSQEKQIQAMVIKATNRECNVRRHVFSGQYLG